TLPGRSRGDDARGGRRSGRMVAEVFLGQASWCEREPGVEQGLAEVFVRHRGQLDEHRGEAVEMWDREESGAVFGEHRLLSGEVFNADGQDWTLRRLLVPEPSEIRFAERTLPCEDLAVDRPRPV